MRKAMRVGWFTLVELLVVISIIALLAVMLLPALGKARQRGKAISCANQLKTISTVVMLYAQDHADFLPSSHDGLLDGNAQTFQVVMTTYFNPNYDTRTCLPKSQWEKYPWRCPAEEVVWGDISAAIATYYGNYTLNGDILKIAGHRRLNEFKSPSRCGIMWDGDVTAPVTSYAYCASSATMLTLSFGGPHYRHLEGCNILFLDGHIGSAKTQATLPIGRKGNDLWE